MSLVTYSDLMVQSVKDPTRKVYEVMAERVADSASPMPPKPNKALEAVQVATLQGWVKAGPQKGVCTSSSVIPPGMVAVPTCDADVTVKSTSEWEMPQATGDEYVCYGLDLPVSAKRHATAIYPLVNNKTIVHHMILFQGSKSYNTTPTVCDSGNSLEWKFIAGWAPGTQPIALPEEAGFPLEGTAHFIVQVHYSNLNHLSGQKDGSGFSLCTTDQLRKFDADVMAFGTTSIQVPPHSTLDQTCEYTVPSGLNGIRAIASLPHMHKTGTAISTTQITSDGTKTDLGTSAAWSFDSQFWYPLNATLREGDKIQTRCAWQNTTDTKIKFGERTSDEMCYSFTMYYPRVESPFWTWGMPASEVKCTKNQ